MRKKIVVLPLIALVSLLWISTEASGQCINVPTAGAAVTENFNALPNTPTATNNPWTDNSTLPAAYSTRTTFRAANGSENTGSLYSFGAAAAADRALGGIGSGGTGTFYWALCFTNGTGSAVSSFDIAYVAEQWRNGGANAAHTTAFEYQVANAGAITDADTPATGWTAVTALDMVSPIFSATAATLDGNAAANRVSLANTVTASVANGQQVWVRWRDIDNTGGDHALAADDFSITLGSGGPVTPTLSISDVSQIEGDAGTTNFTFAVTLSAPAGVGGVTFSIGTADGTATDADNDYDPPVPNPLTGQSIPSGSSGPYNFVVVVNGDVTVEANQTFFVNVTSVVGATVADGQGQGTIQNDDLTLTPIHDIQGPGASSPIVGNSVTTRGVVTGVRSNGFFIQEPDATVDADPATSEGVLVFTNAAPPGAAVVGNLVQVTGTVAEFVPSADPLQPPLTELTSPTVTLVSSGNPMPAAIPLTTSFPSPAGPHDQLERLEAMRVSVAALTVTGPTLGNTNEPSATETSTGVFYGVVQGNARPFREAGIPAPDPAPTGEIPAGTIPPIPRFDSNPERIRVDSDGLVGGTLLDVGFGQTVSNLVGPLDYTFRTYTILPDVGSSPVVSGGVTEIAASITAANEFTVASYNLERFFDDVNDPGIGEPVLTTTAYNNRLGKASRQIRNFLRFPDIIGVIEVENLTTLQTLATQINNDAVANSQPNPLYTPFLVEGNDVGGIDVGFLVKTSIVFGSNPRVSVNSVTQELDGTLFVNADSSTETLHDRPPLRLDAVVNGPSGGPGFPITVIVNHLRSLGSVNSEAAGTNGWTTAGERVRAKRQAQAEDLANLIQARQVGNPAESIVVMGDLNAFEVNDGLGHTLGVLQGTPVPNNETAVAGDGVDLVNPDLDNLFDNGPAVADRYSYTFDGNAQSLDHILVNQPLISATAARRIEHPRINADFAAIDRNDYSTTGNRALSDHDPVVAFFTVTGLPVELLNFDVE
jgi:predicted extracellular nuclease